jgi:hypothetical protein
MTTTFVHGKNGLIYLSGTELSAANAWNLKIDTDSAETSVFGDSWKSRQVGLNDWSGNVSGFHDQDSKPLQTAATAGVSVALLIYPKRSDLSTYYSGSAIFSFSSEAGMDAAVGASADFVGNGALTMTGFAT